MRKTARNLISLFIAAVMILMVTVIPASADGITLPQNEAMSFVNSMGAGWNLGNSFDSHGCTWLSDKLDYEAGWCGVKASKALIKTVKNAGFGTIRIPVTWYEHVDAQYNIDNAWLNRVAEVIDWCLDEDLYVILDVHHDVLHNWYYPSSSELAGSTAYMKKIWEQLADKFRNYGNKLIFEPINEPRLVDSTYQWWYERYNIPEEVKDSLECINKLNQTALDAIRASGGNNASRYVLVGGYDTDGTWKGALSPYFRLPTDNVSNRLIVDAHIYGNSSDINKLGELDGLYNGFTSQGIPVVVSEYGLDSGGYDYIGKEEAAAVIMKQFGEYARERGISVVLWDNNSGSNGQAGHKFIDRATATVVTPQILSEFTEANKPSAAAAVIDSVDAIPDQIYTGLEIKPVLTVKSGGTVLTENRDYTVSYSNNIGVGTATVTVTGKGSYTGTKTASFNIVSDMGIMYGDVNGDQKINAKDVLAIRKYIVKADPGKFILAAADVNADNKVNAKDVLKIRKYIVDPTSGVLGQA